MCASVNFIWNSLFGRRRACPCNTICEVCAVFVVPRENVPSEEIIRAVEIYKQGSSELYAVHGIVKMRAEKEIWCVVKTLRRRTYGCCFNGIQTCVLWLRHRVRHAGGIHCFERIFVTCVERHKVEHRKYLLNGGVYIILLCRKAAHYTWVEGNWSHSQYVVDVINFFCF